MDWDKEAEQQPAAQPETPRRSWGKQIAFTAAGLVAGGILGITVLAGAQTPSSSPSTTTTAPAVGRHGGGDPAKVGHGPDETLLTGTTASKVRAAALKAVPGATVIRLETDSDGSPYEAHLKKSDGTFVTVKVDKNFNVTDTEEGFGGHGPR
jgi:hypothetical protein